LLALAISHKEEEQAAEDTLNLKVVAKGEGHGLKIMPSAANAEVRRISGWMYKAGARSVSP
jgi:hypothetical protein